MPYKSANTSANSRAGAGSTGLARVDKTMHIPQLESGTGSNALLFLRPPGFGKTFIADMLFRYYDKSLSGRLDENFGGA